MDSVTFVESVLAVHAPLHPANSWSVPGTALRVTTCPDGYDSAQSAPQAIPGGNEDTFPAPTTLTASGRTTVVTLRFAVVVDVPDGVVTAILPVVAPPGVTKLNVASSITVNDAATVPTTTLVASENPLPSTVTVVVPGSAAFGENDAMCGKTTNAPALVAVPDGVFTAIGPPAAPSGTTALTVVALTSVNPAASTPPNVTESTPWRFVPVIVTVAPAIPLAGENDEHVGGPGAVIVPALTAVPNAFVTAIFPVPAVCTKSCMLVSELIRGDAGAPAIVAEVTPEKPLPVRVTQVPAYATVGEKLVMAGNTPKELALVPVPSGVVTAIGPLATPAGTVALSDVALTGVTDVLETPPNETSSTFANPDPVTVTSFPSAPVVGVKLVTVGAAPVNNAALVAVAAAFFTVIFALTAPAGTLVSIRESDTRENDATTVPNFTCVVPVNPPPVIVTEVPAAPLVGVNASMRGAIFNAVALVPDPTGVVTERTPEMAPAGTTRDSDVSLATVNEAVTAPTATAVAPVKPLPVTVTVAPC